MVSPEQGVPRSFLESHRHDANRGGSQRRARRQRGQEPGGQMANVAVLLLRLHAKIFRVIAAAHAGAETAEFVNAGSSGWRYAVIVGAIGRNRSEPDWRLRAVRVNRPYLVVCLVALTSCGTTSTHQFARAARHGQTRTGKLRHRKPNATVTGDASGAFRRNGAF